MKPGIAPAEIDVIDLAIKLQLDLLRHSSVVESSILALLEQMRRELIAKLSAVDLTAFGKARLNELLKESTLLIDAYYKQAQAILAPTYEVVSGISAAQTVASVAATASMPSRTMLETLIKNTLIEGSPAAQWWTRMSADTAFKFSAAIRQGVIQGETQTAIYKRVNLISELAKRNSKALVHTAVMQAASDANMAVLEANADVAPSIRWLSTLDIHTCPAFCGPRDGLEWDTITKEPIGHNMPWIDTPAHFGCRCKILGVTKYSKMGSGQRAAAGGPVDRKVTFTDFIARQTPEWQDKNLGAGRADLYRRGVITLRDVASGGSSPLTLEQLKARYP